MTERERIDTIHLTLELGDRPDQRFGFSQTRSIGVGRKPGCAVCIPDGRVSGFHGELVFTERGWVYRDLRSTNGSMVARGQTRTVVDGAVMWEVAVQSGDRLLLGDVDDPVVLRVDVKAAEGAEQVEAQGTVVARRPVERASDLGSVVFGLAPAREAASLVALLKRVGGESDSAAVFAHVGRFLLERMPGADAVLLVAGDDSAPLMLARGASAPTPVLEEPPPFPRGVVASALANREGVLSGEVGDAEQSLRRVGARGAIAVPLLDAGKATAALVVMGAGLGPAELDLGVALGWQVSSSFATARLVKRLRAVERRLRDENRYLKAQVRRDGDFGHIIGDSAALKTVFEQMKMVMATDATVLVLGETGTGKELVARALHAGSPRRGRLFAALNCAALSESLLESELFGHVRGAFTGATSDKKGLFQVAHGGTLFLDELGELSVGLQSKLLRVLQEGEVLPVGSTRPIKVDVRIVAATHRDLKAMVREGSFRQDLYYRIKVFPIRVPALRDRRSDIAALAQFFLERYAAQFGKEIRGFSASALEVLARYDWPGNIRELENEVQRAVLMTPTGRVVDARAFSEDVHGGGSGLVDLELRDGTLKETMDALEREVLRRALELRGWNRSQTARELGISRQALLAKLTRHHLRPD